MSNRKKPKVVTVVGPTASGKTDLTIKLAEHFAGEVISADSRQVYCGLDIGTAKVTPEEMAGIPHHLIDVADVQTIYTAADFKRGASAAIADITSRGKLPIIAGGTFFYVDALLGNVQLPEVPPNETLRAELEEKDITELLALLTELDPTRAQTIDAQNKRRLIRAIEIAEVLGSVSAEKTECPYEVLTIGLITEKETLRERFGLRAKNWLEGGLLQEVEGLLAQGITKGRLQEIGFEYTLALELLDGGITEEQFTQKFIEKNWQYAKRQLTWLKRDQTIRWFDKDDKKIFEEVEGFYSRRFPRAVTSY
ncbi:tRNA (adenosine(37)-N6)-dimethylallyltransferase MiaA [Candidatus Nomurabacteria bacterium]|nr:tRNA (adenosine(37)-N6)-dimethylallyltransferase MiaA [Candidatus Nomurabacteria bacterium]